MLEIRILNNDLEIWISTFPREELAKWHSLLLSANPIKEQLSLQWIIGGACDKSTDEEWRELWSSQTNTHN